MSKIMSMPPSAAYDRGFAQLTRYRCKCCGWYGSEPNWRKVGFINVMDIHFAMHCPTCGRILNGSEKA